MHLHLHLKDCTENYGSVYGFLLFSFECYNSLLGSFSTNNHDIEVQLMRKFLSMSSLDDQTMTTMKLAPHWHISEIQQRQK